MFWLLIEDWKLEVLATDVIWKIGRRFLLLIKLRKLQEVLTSQGTYEKERSFLLLTGYIKQKEVFAQNSVTTYLCSH